MFVWSLVFWRGEADPDQMGREMIIHVIILVKLSNDILLILYILEVTLWDLKYF